LSFDHRCRFFVLSTLQANHPEYRKIQYPPKIQHPYETRPYPVKSLLSEMDMKELTALAKKPGFVIFDTHRGSHLFDAVRKASEMLINKINGQKA